MGFCCLWSTWFMMNCWKWCLELLHSWGSATLSLLLLLPEHFLPQRPFDSSLSPISTVLLPNFLQQLWYVLDSSHITVISRRQTGNKFTFLHWVLLFWWHPIHYAFVVFISPLRVQCSVLINPKCFLVSSSPCCFHLLRLQYIFFPASCVCLCPFLLQCHP